jgi:RNA polymerase sigma factor (TIGR02999 family)
MAAPEPDPESHEITALLRAASDGRREALDDLLPLVYDQLSGMAHARLRHETPGHTLETAGLVHEAWLRLINQHRAEWQDRRHFFAVASEAMRRVLVDHARKRRSAKRGGPSLHLSIDAVEKALGASAPVDPDDTLLALDAALTRLAGFNAAGADVVQYRFFAGLTMLEVAEQMGVSERTVRRSWSAARAWLRREVSATGGAAG